MFVKAPEKLDEFYVDIIADELNVKEVEFTDDVSHYTTYKFKPQLRQWVLSMVNTLARLRQF